MRAAEYPRPAENARSMLFLVAGGDQCNGPAQPPHNNIVGLSQRSPIFTGTRVPVQALLDYIEGGDTLDEFLEDFPNVTRQHAVAVMGLAQAGKRGMACPS